MFLRLVVYRCLLVICASLIFDHFRPNDCFRESRLADTGDSGSSRAEQDARANADICHGACDLMSFEMKDRSSDRDDARGAPDAVVAHL
jgi:hypothetical protein